MGSLETVASYIGGIRNYVRYLDELGYDCETVIEMEGRGKVSKVKDFDPDKALNLIKTGKVNVQKTIDSFIDYGLEEKDWTHKSTLTYLFGVKKWLDTNGVVTEGWWENLEMPTGSEVREIDRAPKREELITMMNHCFSTRDRAVIEVLASSGLRIGTLLSLTIDDVDFSFPDVAMIKVRRKTGRKFGGRRKATPGRFYATFITPEAKQILQEYLKERKRAGENLTNESPLITDDYNKGTFLTRNGYRGVWSRLLERSGLAEKSNRWFKLHIHTLRKYFRSNCKAETSYREFWMGHKGGYLDESYFRAELEKHLTEYRKTMSELSIYTKPEDQTWKTVIRTLARAEGKFDEEKLKLLEEILARAKNMDEGIESFKKLKDKEFVDTQPNGNGPYVNGNGYEAKVVNESQLIAYVERGWDVVKELSDGRFIVRKQNGRS